MATLLDCALPTGSTRSKRSLGRPRRFAVAPAIVAAFLRSLPNYEHDLATVVLHFRGTTLASRDGRTKTPEFEAWVQAVHGARQILEEETKGVFRKRRDGRRVRHFLAGVPT